MRGHRHTPVPEPTPAEWATDPNIRRVGWSSYTWDCHHCYTLHVGTYPNPQEAWDAFCSHRQNVCLG